MKIAFLVYSSGISGGLNVIMEHARAMSVNGISVYIINVNPRDSNLPEWHHHYSNIKILNKKDGVAQSYDVVISTFWKTCIEMLHFEATHYVYFNQSVESRFYKDVNVSRLADLTYLFGSYVITEATWIKKYLQDNYSINAFLVRNGINKDIYSEYLENRPINNGLFRILIEGPVDVEFKNVRKTIKICKASNADEVWLLTSSNIKKIRGVDRVFSRIPYRDTPAIYSKCDLIVKLSLVEGMFGPPLEMFHCGGTAIVYDVSGFDEYIKHEHNALVVKTGDESKVVEYINYLYSDRQSLHQLQSNALKTAMEWRDWNQSSMEFIGVINKILEMPSNKMSVKKSIERLLYLFKLDRMNVDQMSHMFARLKSYEMLMVLVLSVLIKIKKIIRDYSGGCRLYFGA